MLQKFTLTGAALAALLATPASAASSKFCVDGGWTVLGRSGREFRGDVDAPTGDFKVRGKYTEFTVDPATFAIYNYAWLGKANVGDMTGQKYTPIFASKVPDHRGAELTSRITVRISDETLKISRSGPAGSMTLTAKDCSQGGIFQMEPERADNTSTRIVHQLSPGVYNYDNPNFRANLGKFLGSECENEVTGPPSFACVRVSPRVNIGAVDRPALVLRDSAQVAKRIPQPDCGPDFTNSLGLTETKDYCGGLTIWDVASGGRMGMVTGEDSVEVANPPTNCVSNCQPEEEGDGELAVLGFPSPVPEELKLKPWGSQQGFDAALTKF